MPRSDSFVIITFVESILLLLPSYDLRSMFKKPVEGEPTSLLVYVFPWAASYIFWSNSNLFYQAAGIWIASENSIPHPPVWSNVMMLSWAGTFRSPSSGGTNTGGGGSTTGRVSVISLAKKSFRKSGISVFWSDFGSSFGVSLAFSSVVSFFVSFFWTITSCTTTYCSFVLFAG